MNSGLNGLPSHNSKPSNVITELLSVSGTASSGQTQATAANPVLLTGPGTVTGSDTTPAVNITPTWNTTGNATALKVNPANTASGASSLLMDLQLSGSSILNITKTGHIVTTGNIEINASASGDFFRFGVGTSTGACSLSGFNITASSYAAADVFLMRAAAAALQQGAPDAIAPVAQTTQVQSVIAGQANTAAGDWTLQASRPTGTGTAGNIVVKTGFKGLSQNATVTVTAATPAVVTYTTHGFVPGMSGQFTTTTTLPSGLSLATTYYVLSTGLTASAFQVSLTPGGTAINCTDTGTGTQTFTTNTTTQNPASTVMTVGPSGLTGSQAVSGLEVNQTWNTSGSAYAAIKANITFISGSGVILDCQKAGVSQFSVGSFGAVIGTGLYTISSRVGLGDSSGYAVNAANTYSIGWVSSTNTLIAPDTLLTRAAAATLQQGAADAAAPVAQTTRVQSVVAGTSVIAGTDWTRIASKGTDTAASGNIIEQTGFSAKSGTSGVQHSVVDRKILVAKGKVLTSGAAFSMFDVALPTLTMCGGVIEATIVCTDGTDMQSFTQTVTYSAVNKGGVYTTSITASTGDKSVSAGTLTTSWTIVSGTNKVTIKVTPTTSLTPSTNAFLLYYTVKNNSEQATTIL